MVEEELCRQAFAMFDISGTGTISKTDLTSLLRAMGQNPTDSQVNDMINEVDVDGSGVVQFGEFVNFFNRLMRNLNPDNEVREAFRRFDPDNDGFVSLDELKFVMSNLPVRVSEEEVEEMVRAVDVGRDGKISQDKFSQLMGHQQSSATSAKSAAKKAISRKK